MLRGAVCVRCFICSIAVNIICIIRTVGPGIVSCLVVLCGLVIWLVSRAVGIGAVLLLVRPRIDRLHRSMYGLHVLPMLPVPRLNR